MDGLPTSEAEIDGFLAAFEDCSLPKARWTHGAHVLTGACYVHALGEAGAAERMRLCVSRYNEAVGGKNTATSGYHETVTVFWIKMLAKHLGQRGDMRRAEFAAWCVETLAPVRDLLRGYYSYDLIASLEARREWRAPDVRPL